MKDIDLELTIYQKSKILRSLNPVSIPAPRSDVIVFDVTGQLEAEKIDYELSIRDYTSGQDCFFLGYPLGIGLAMSRDSTKPDLAFVKKAIISGKASLDGIFTIFLDGMNNPGFSGGPWVFFDRFKKPHIGGVITKYKYIKNEVYDVNQRITDQYVRENTGIIYTQSIQEALDQIDS